MTGCSERVKLSFLGGILCAVFGPILGTISLLLFPIGSGNLINAMAAIPFVSVMGVITVGPFGFVEGVVASWLIVVRIQADVSTERIRREAMVGGALLGSLAGLVFQSAMFAAIGILVGTICALMLVFFFRRHFFKRVIVPKPV